jgi:hypothetical protein
MPKTFREEMISILNNKNFITKVGVALDISDIPDEYPLKEKVLKWESRFWEKQIKENQYLAIVDTTFALYRPKYKPHCLSKFLNAIRIAGNYTAKHGGWYIVPELMTEEQTYYFQNNVSTTWIFTENGKLQKKDLNISYLDL